MRTLFEIIEEAKSNGRPTYDELFYALLAYSAMHSLVKSALQHDTNRQIWKQSAHKTAHNALKSDPEKYLGDHIPSNPQYQRNRKAAIKLLDKVIESNTLK